MKDHAYLLRRAICFLTAVILIAVCFPALGESTIYPWINSDVEGNVRLLTNVRLKDDFHLAVNKQWLLLTNVPYQCFCGTVFPGDGTEDRTHAG